MGFSKKLLWKTGRILLLSFILVPLLGLVTLPWYFGLILRPVAAHYGASFESYEMLGYERFSLSEIDVDIKELGIKVNCKKLEAPMALHYIFSRDRNFSASGWRVQIDSSTPTSSANHTTGLAIPSLVNQILNVNDTLEAYFDGIALADGTIVSEEVKVYIQQLDLENGKLSARGNIFEEQVPFEATVSLKRDKPITLQVALPSYDSNLDSTIMLESNAVSTTLQIRYRDNVITATANWNTAGWFPSQAELSCSDFALPDEYANLLPGYRMPLAPPLPSWTLYPRPLQRLHYSHLFRRA